MNRKVFPIALLILGGLSSVVGQKITEETIEFVNIRLPLNPISGMLHYQFDVSTDIPHPHSKK